MFLSLAQVRVGISNENTYFYLLKFPLESPPRKRKTGEEIKHHLEYALRVRFLHRCLRLVVSLSGIWQGRTLLISES